MIVRLDFETFSPVDLSKAGLWAYSHHPETRVLLATAVCETRQKSETFVYDERAEGADPQKIRLLQILQDATEIHAWNAPFEWHLIRHCLGLAVTLERMHCTMAHALYRAFPASLDQCARALGFAGKTPEAARLIRTFCMPRKKGGPKERPGDWQRFIQYNMDDVKLEGQIAGVLSAYPWPTDEREVWLMSERVNLRGTPIDIERARMGRDMFAKLQSQAEARIAEITGVSNPNSAMQLRIWVESRGVATKSLDKEHVADILKGTQLPDDVREVLLLRSGAAMSAPKKYDVALKQTHDGLIRSMLQYSGAGRTHRYSGRGLQPQNLRRGMKYDGAIETAWEVIAIGDVDLFRTCYPAPFKLVADLVRSIVRHPTASITVADYASIEVVMLWWLAGAKSLLQTFRDGQDPYKTFAASHFGIPYDEVTDEQRTFAKPPVLGGGYGLGPSTLVEYAAGMGITIAPDDAAKAIRSYRSAHEPVTQLWAGLENAMRLTITTGKSYAFGHVTFKKQGAAVLMVLPSGTDITYWNARIQEDTWPDGRPKQGGTIAYDGINQYTNGWDTITTWGGKLVENAVQSISRDVLVVGLQRAIVAGLDVVLHVHDEIVAVGGHADRLAACMTAPPWCADAPIRANAFVCRSYRKD